MAKRPFQNSNGGNWNKRQKQDFEAFKAPDSRNGSSTNGFQNKISAGGSKLVMPKPLSIIDHDNLLDDDDDEIFILASQNAEEEERRLNLERVQKAKEIDMLNYSTCFNPGTSTSTQHHNRGTRVSTQTGYTEQIRNELFVDLTGENESMAPPKPSNRPALKDAPPPYKFSDEGSTQSQKENISASQTLTRQSNQIKALQIQLKNAKAKEADQQEKLLAKDGEVSTLRRDKITLETTIKDLKLQKLKDAELNKANLEVQRLQREIQRLKETKEFDAFNQSSIRVGPAVPKVVEQTSMVSFFTNIRSPSASQSLVTSIKAFEEDEPLPKDLDLRMKAVANKLQKTFAQLQLRILSNGNIDDATISSVFVEASQTILLIEKYIKLKESAKEKIITYDKTPALSACIEISSRCLRDKLTKFNSAANVLDAHEGYLTLQQTQKLFHDELCDKPRLIIALYASICRYSRKFSERILLDKVEDENGNSRTFSETLRDLLVDWVTESEKVFEYSGFAMASASLLASLAYHYDNFEPNRNIDTSLADLFRAVLECRCDNAFVMQDLSEFLSNVSKNPQKPNLVSMFCVNFPKENIEVSNKYSYSSYPQDACAFQLFLMYILTAFNPKEDLNRLELDLLLQTSMNLNRITSNIQDMPVGTVKFLQQDREDTVVCSCFPTLVHAILSLNYLVLQNRNFQLSQATSNCPGNLQGIVKLSKYNKQTAELARSSVSMLNDLFNCIDKFSTFPIEKLVFANKLEAICKILKYESFLDAQGNRVSCYEAFNLAILKHSLKSITISPNLEFEQGNEPMNEDPTTDQNLIDACQNFANCNLGGDSN